MATDIQGDYGIKDWILKCSLPFRLILFYQRSVLLDDTYSLPLFSFRMPSKQWNS